MPSKLLDDMMATLIAQNPQTPEERIAIELAIAALARGQRTGAAAQPKTGSTEPTQPTITRLPEDSPFYGLGLKEASFKQLSMSRPKHEQTAREIWAVLAAAGFQSAHSDPPHAVLNALSKRAKKHQDVLLVGGGKWGLKSWYTDDELEEIKKSVGGMGGRDRGAHSERTRAGMLKAKQRGAKIGAALLMTPEVLAQVDDKIRRRVSVRAIAAEFKVTPQAIYQHYDRETLRRMREEGPIQSPSEDNPRQLRVIK